MPNNLKSLEELYLHSNYLQELPKGFENILQSKLRVLNVSCNKLNSLLKEEACSSNFDAWPLEEFFGSNNKFCEKIWDYLTKATRLRNLHLAYNRLSSLSENVIKSWPLLEELILSGNMLQQLPSNLGSLCKLKILRVHSNLLLSLPALSRMSELKVLDLAHNHLDYINLSSIMPKQLKYLDLSCNIQLQVDETQVMNCQKQRKWSLVDVSGMNRSNLPTNKLCQSKELNTAKVPWTVGFSETPGKYQKLLASQLRLGNFRADEALFGIFETEISSRLAASLTQIVPNILEQERAVKETLNEYMKYTLLSAHQKLEYQGMSALLCHISKENFSFRECVRPQRVKRYILRVASVGEIGAYLVRRTSNVCLSKGVHKCSMPNFGRETKNAADTSQAFPDPDIMELILGNEDEYLIIANGKLWTVLDIDRVVREVRKEDNMLLAAKRVQDIAQSFGAQENLSIIVIRFRNIAIDVDHLINELKQTVRKVSIPTATSCRHRLLERANPFQNAFNKSLMSHCMDRSSPSGQSDQTLNLMAKDEEDFILAHAHVLEEEDEMEILDENSSVLSEEQFKCWEYMLEQNTQLLFDKELNTISKSYTKNRHNERQKTNLTADKFEAKPSLLKNLNNKFLSSSTPQLLYSEIRKPNSYNITSGLQQQHHNHSQSFLSKTFGSTRSFQTSLSAAGFNLFDGKQHENKITGGPNAAYFGSLQRIMPYSSEYDFSVMQERCMHDEFEPDEDDEFNEHENRMSKYWGVATTEL